MNRDGYTLFELILVLTLVVILAALAYPSFNAMYAQFKLDSTADTVKAALTSARAQAIEEGQPYRFAIIPGKGNFRVAPDGAAFWSGPDALADAAADGRPPFVLEDSLPRSTVFLDADQGTSANVEGETALAPQDLAPEMWRPVAVFLPDGTARVPDDSGRHLVEIVVRGEGIGAIAITLRCLTGTVSTERVFLGGNP